MWRAHLRGRGIACLELEKVPRLLQNDVFLKKIIHHRHRRSSTRGEAFDEFDRIRAIRRNRDGIPMPAVLLVRPFFQVDPRRLCDLLFQLVTPRQRARQRATHAHMPLPGRHAAEHRVERHQFQHIDRREFQLGCDPGDRLVRNKAEVFLPKVQERQRCRAFRHRVMRDRFLDLRGEFGGNLHGLVAAGAAFEPSSGTSEISLLSTKCNSSVSSPCL